jgi:hypothetical protein
MRLVLEKCEGRTLLEDRSLDGIKRYVITDDDGFRTQIFNSLWYTLEYVREVLYENETR